ncbi:MAG: hypothetical protein ACRDRW_17990 [Pseudonocardiaceae bacterium]
MTKKSPRRSTSGKALILGALLTVAVPGIAYANTVSVTVQTPGTTSGPGSSFAEIETDADCSQGALISGGGIDQVIGTGMASNGNHVMGTEPRIPRSDNRTPAAVAPTVTVVAVTVVALAAGTRATSTGQAVAAEAVL